MYCRIVPRNYKMLFKGKKVRELYFIQEGSVGLYDKAVNENPPFLILPKHSVFGDYQILFDL